MTEQSNQLETLSNVPSKAIRQTIEDMRVIQEDDNYTIRMSTWHAAQYAWCSDKKPRCAVCFAGGTMARRLGADPHSTLTPEDFPEHCDMLVALDFFRTGNIKEGLKSIGKDHKEHKLPAYYEDPEGYDVPAYSDGPEEFFASMEKLAAILEKAGL